MRNKISQEHIEKFLRIKGEVRGMALKSHAEFIRQTEGEGGLKKLEKKMTEWEHPINYQTLESMRFYPVGLEALTLIAIKEIFSFDNKRFKEIGVFGSKYSLIMKFFMKYIFSLKLLAKQAPAIWRKYYTIGEFKVIKLDKKKKQIVMRLENFKLHPLHCLHLAGYCASVVKMAVKSPATCEQTKCPFKGDKYHEFVIKW